MNATEFESLLRERGYGDAKVREYEPNLDSEMHTHDFSAMLLVTGGVFTLALEEGAESFSPGEWCEVLAGTVHAEYTGPEGATALIARK